MEVSREKIVEVHERKLMSLKRDKPDQDSSFEEQETLYRRNRVTPGTQGRLGEIENMEEIKEMLLDFQKDLKREMEEIKVEIRQSIKEFKREIGELKEQLEESREEVKAMRVELNEVKMERGEVKEEMERNLNDMDKRVERLERDKIRNNLIVTGINIDGKMGEQLKTTMRDMLERELGVKAEIEKALKINSKKCVVEMQRWTDKVKIMEEKKKLRGKNIFIDADLTRKEREVQRKIRERAREERVRGRKTRVGYQKLWIDGKEFRWDDQREELDDRGSSVTKN